MPPVARETSARTRRMISWMSASGSAIWCTSASVKGLFRPSPSSATLPGCVEKAMNEPTPASIRARPRLAPPAERVATASTNGLSRQASRITSRVSACSSMLRSTDCSRTDEPARSAAPPIAASTGMR